MTILNSVIHRLQKERNKESILTFRDDILKISDPLEELLQETLKVYNDKTGKSYGIFEKDTSVYPFSLILKEYLLKKMNFIKFTTWAMKSFKQKIDRENFATGGYVLFIHYEKYLIVFMLNDKSGVSIDDTTLDLLGTNHLDLEKLHLAARVDLKSWQDGKKKQYLSFVKGRQSGDGVARYFREFLGCSDYSDSKEQTQNLLKAVEDYCSFKKMEQDDFLLFKQRTFDYCDNKRKSREPVYINDLSYFLDEENPIDFLKFSNSDEYGLSNGFEPHRDTLKRLKRISGKDNKLTINFEEGLLGNRIEYIPSEKSLIIHKLPSDLEKILDEKYAGE